MGCKKLSYYTQGGTYKNLDFYNGGLIEKGASDEKKRLNAYGFGFNGQEKDNEIAGIGNINTALFWQYDTRLGRRWNLDPVVKVYESPYATFGGNPIFFADPFGDDKKKVNGSGEVANGEKFNASQDQAELNEVTITASASVTDTKVDKKLHGDPDNILNSKYIGHARMTQYYKGKACSTHCFKYDASGGKRTKLFGYDITNTMNSLGWNSEADYSKANDPHSYMENVLAPYAMKSLEWGVGLRGGIGTIEVASIALSKTNSLTVYSVMQNPQLLEGKSFAVVRSQLSNNPGWEHTIMTGTQGKNKGWVYRELAPNGNLTGRRIQYHPGSSRPDHFNGRPYWKVSDGSNVPFKFLAK